MFKCQNRCTSKCTGFCGQVEIEGENIILREVLVFLYYLQRCELVTELLQYSDLTMMKNYFGIKDLEIPASWTASKKQADSPRSRRIYLEAAVSWCLVFYSSLFLKRLVIEMILLGFLEVTVTGILTGFSSSCPTYCLPDLSGQFELTFTIISLFVLVCVVHTKIKWFVRVKRHKSQTSLDILTKTKIHPSCSPSETCMCA